ncbi:MAG: MarR family transcriptional regulator [Oscillospiraceae bacterium]|nr:MarR family transcriptional regulator [Oscillospiraceae bacterium]
MDGKELLNQFTDMTRIHTAYVERRLLHLDLRTGQGAVLTALGYRGACTQKELAEYRHVSAATISVMLRRMEKTGLVTRSSGEDGKSNLIALTEHGRQVYDRLMEDMMCEPERVFAGLSQEDLQAAERIFRTVSENLAQLSGR